MEGRWELKPGPSIEATRGAGIKVPPLAPAGACCCGRLSIKGEAAGVVPREAKVGTEPAPEMVWKGNWDGDSELLLTWVVVGAVDPAESVVGMKRGGTSLPILLWLLLC